MWTATCPRNTCAPTRRPFLARVPVSAPRPNNPIPGLSPGGRGPLAAAAPRKTGGITFQRVSVSALPSSHIIPLLSTVAAAVVRSPPAKKGRTPYRTCGLFWAHSRGPRPGRIAFWLFFENSERTRHYQRDRVFVENEEWAGLARRSIVRLSDTRTPIKMRKENRTPDIG